MHYPLPELANGNLVRLKEGRRWGVIVGHAGWVGIEPLVSLYIWDSGGRLNSSGPFPEVVVLPASEVVLLRVAGADPVAVGDGWDLYPPCPYCGGAGHDGGVPMRPCRACRGRGRSGVIRRMHPELLDQAMRGP